MRPAIRRPSAFAFTCVVLCSALLVGCEGDTGPAGAQGPAGPPGPAGPSGPPASNSGATRSIDSVGEGERINAVISSVTVPAGGGAPVVDFKLTNALGEGLALTDPTTQVDDFRFAIAQLRPGVGNGSSQWQSYITRDATAGGVTVKQGTVETAAAPRLVDNGNGTYRYTFSRALTAYTGAPAYDGTLTHRVSIDVRDNAPTFNPSFDFVPAGGAVTTQRRIVDSNTCMACHDLLEFHGGGARNETEHCVTCHNPSTTDPDTGNTVDMKVMIHKIHGAAEIDPANPYLIIGNSNSRHDFSDVHYPQDVRNCTTCHKESDANAPQGGNWKSVVNRASCGTCHDELMANPKDPNTGVMNHPGGLVFSDDTQCLGCHGPTSTTNGGAVQTANAHRIPVDVESEKFTYEVISVTNASNGPLMANEQPTATIRVFDKTNNNTNWDIQAPNGPFTTSGASLNLDIGSTQWEFSNVGSSSNYPVASGQGNAPFQPTRINFLAGPASVTNIGGNVFRASATIPTSPAGAPGAGGPFVMPARAALFPLGAPQLRSGGLVAILEGHPKVELDGDPATVLEGNAQVAGAGGTFSWDGDATAPRKSVVDIKRCNECHETLSLHGANRTDNTQLCATCHNPNATDQKQHITPSGNPGRCATLTGDTTQDQSIDLKFLVHSIHGAARRAEQGAPAFRVCGNSSSAYIFVSDETPASESAPFTAAGATVVEVDYPGAINNCQACHVPPASDNPSYYGRDPASTLGTTVRAGANRFDLSDDTAHSATVAACVACHPTSTAIAHMRQNGGVYLGGKSAATGKATTVVGGAIESNESCPLCHGPGRQADIKEVHKIDFYPLNNTP